MGLHQTKTFCTEDKTIHKVKGQHEEWEKIFASHISDKGLISKLYKELIQLNSKKSSNLILKRSEELNRLISKEDIQMIKMDMKRSQHH